MNDAAKDDELRRQAGGCLKHVNELCSSAGFCGPKVWWGGV